MKKQRCTALHVYGSPYSEFEVRDCIFRPSDNFCKHVLPPRHNLTTFSFNSVTLLSSVFEPWTIAALRNSNISALRLDVSSNDCRFVEIVSQTLPNLRELEICLLVAPDKTLRMAKLLARLSALETLRMSSVLVDLSARQAIPLPIPQLSQLTTVAASIPYINYLLNLGAPRALPALTDLEISASLSSTSKPSVSPLGRLAAVFEGLERHRLAPRITLALTCTDSQTPLDWACKAFDHVLGDEWTRWASTVRVLSISVRAKRPGPRHPHLNINQPYLVLLRHRLKIFSALAEVRFEDGCKYGHRDEPLRRLAEADALAVVMGASPRVDRIVVNSRVVQLGSRTLCSS
uniref:F-box domain-containing protein n=1 Tax=Mycena chlorophos TaxID=658473 RepID=A0ABQ0LZB1_MYCCL|nr:predicted protein [Mycena chlorophos]